MYKYYVTSSSEGNSDSSDEEKEWDWYKEDDTDTYFVIHTKKP